MNHPGYDYDREKPDYAAVRRADPRIGGPLLDCTDGFQEAFYGRPEAFLDPQVRRAQSAWGFVDAATEASCVGALEAALASGAWDERWGHLRRQPTFEGAYRLLEYRL